MQITHIQNSKFKTVIRYICQIEVSINLRKKQITLL